MNSGDEDFKDKTAFYSVF